MDFKKMAIEELELTNPGFLDSLEPAARYDAIINRALDIFIEEDDHRRRREAKARADQAAILRGIERRKIAAAERWKSNRF